MFLMLPCLWRKKNRYHERGNNKEGKRRKRRNNKRNYGDKDYGPYCEKPDMNESTYTIQLEKRREKEKEMMENRNKYEETSSKEP